MSRILTGLHLASKKLVMITIMLLVMVMMALGLVYWLSQAVEDRQDEIAQWAEKQLGYPVLIGDAGIHWLNLSPKLQLDAISLLSVDRQTILFSFDALYIGLDFLASVQQGEPVINNALLTGMNASIIRGENDEIVIQGFDRISISADNDPARIKWLSVLQKIQLQTVQIHYSDHVLPRLSGEYQIANAMIEQHTDHWNMQAQTRLPQHLGQQMSISSDFTVDDAHQWHMDLQTSSLNMATFNAIALNALPPTLIWQDVEVKKGRLDLSLSIKGEGKTASQIDSTFALRNTTMSSRQKESSLVVIEQLSGTIAWQQKTSLWQVVGNNIQLKVNGEQGAETAFTFKHNNDGSWLLLSDYLRLSDITAFALLSDNSPELLRKQKPAGEMSNLAVTSSINNEITGLSFTLQEGAVEPWRDYPGVTGLSLNVDWNEGLAEVDFTSHKLTLYADKWLDKAVFFDSMTGGLSWKKGAQQEWTFKSDGLYVWNNELSLQLKGSVEQGANGDIVNDISLILNDIDLQYWKNYVPEKILGKSFKRWSRHAFSAGMINDGLIEWKGKIADFPYKNKSDNAYFKMALNVEDVQLHYAPGWPDLMGMKGEITGHGHDLIIKSQQGKIADFDIVNATTIIKKLNEINPILTTQAILEGTTNKASLFIQSSPLNARFGSVLKLAEIKGLSNIDLNLMVPLADVDDVEVSGSVSFIDSQLQTTSPMPLAVTKVNGQLHFDNKGVYAENINAHLFNDDITINVSPKGESMIVSVRGNVSKQNLEGLYPGSIPDFIEGQLAYKADITVQEKSLGDFYVNYDVMSDLKGLNINLPAPFKKEEAQAVAFKAAMKTINKDEYAVQYGKHMQAIFQPQQEEQGKHQWRGAINLGEQPLILPSHGIKVQAEFSDISIDDWLVWARGSNTTAKNELVESIDAISLSVKQLSGFNQTLTSLNASMNKDLQGWRIKLKSDQTQGTIYYPLAPKSTIPLEIDLDKVSLLLPENADIATSVSTLWPAMKLNISSLTIDDTELGTLELNASRTNTAWHLNAASLNSDLFNAKVTGDKNQWQQLPTGDKTRLSLELKSHNVEQLMAKFGYHQVIEAATTAITLDLSWADSPLNFAIKALTGTLNLTLEKGKLKDVEPGAAGRIFGLMSIAALPRRFALDFGDLFSKGFSFNTIQGDFDFTHGLANSDNFSLKGAAADIDIAGSVDLINQQYDQVVNIRPNVSSTLPVAGAVAGGPIGLGVGAAILVIDKLAGSLFDENIVNLISYNYALTGSWDDPELSIIKLTTQ